MNRDWKARLRYGKLSTRYTHYTMLADGVVEHFIEDFDCSPGTAWMGMKAWALDIEQAVDMITVIGEDIGFKITGKIETYVTEPSEPPREKPFGYDIKFTHYG